MDTKQNILDQIKCYVFDSSSNLINESVDNLFKESGLTGYEYEIPEDKEKMLYDFYMSTLLNGNVKDQGSVSDLDLHHLEFTVNHTRHKLYTTLQRELLNAVFFSLSAELRHFLDSDTIEHAKKILNKPEWEVYKKYLEKSAADSRYGLEPIRKVRRSFKSSQEGYIDSYKAAKGADPEKETMVSAMEKLYSQGQWASSYGGKAWAGIAKAWQKLNNVQIKGVDDTKGLNEVMIWIDHVYDLQHNTDTVFNKIKTYAKNGGYMWLKKALDYKRDIKNPYGMFDKITHSMKRLAAFTFKSKENTSLEQYLRDNNQWLSKRSVSDATAPSSKSSTKDTGDKNKFDFGDTVNINKDETSYKDLTEFGISLGDAKTLYSNPSLVGRIVEYINNDWGWVYKVKFDGILTWWYKEHMLVSTSNKSPSDTNTTKSIIGAKIGDIVISNENFSRIDFKIGLKAKIKSIEDRNNSSKHGTTVEKRNQLIYVDWLDTSIREKISGNGWFAYKFDKVEGSTSSGDEPITVEEPKTEFESLEGKDLNLAYDQNANVISIGDHVRLVNPNVVRGSNVHPTKGAKFHKDAIDGHYNSFKNKIGVVKRIKRGAAETKNYGYASLITIVYENKKQLVAFSLRLSKVDGSKSGAGKDENESFVKGEKVAFIGSERDLSKWGIKGSIADNILKHKDNLTLGNARGGLISITTPDDTIGYVGKDLVQKIKDSNNKKDERGGVKLDPEKLMPGTMLVARSNLTDEILKAWKVNVPSHRKAILSHPVKFEQSQKANLHPTFKWNALISLKDIVEHYYVNLDYFELADEGSNTPTSDTKTTEFKAGDKVKYVGTVWKSDLRGKPGTVVLNARELIKVDFGEGHGVLHVYPTSIAHLDDNTSSKQKKANKNTIFKAGDKIQAKDTLTSEILSNEMHIGVDKYIEEILLKTLTIIQTDVPSDEGDIIIKTPDGSTWTVFSKYFTKVGQGDDDKSNEDKRFSVGDKVEYIGQLTPEYKGKYGVVTQLNGAVGGKGSVEVKFNDMSIGEKSILKKNLKNLSSESMTEDLNDPMKNYKSWKNPPFKNAATSGKKSAEKVIKRWNDLATGKTKDSNFSKDNREPLNQLQKYLEDLENLVDLDEAKRTIELTSNGGIIPKLQKHFKSVTSGRRVDKGKYGGMNERKMSLLEKARRSRKAQRGNLKAKKKSPLSKIKKVNNAKNNPFAQK